MFVLGGDAEVVPGWPAQAEQFSTGMNLTSQSDHDGRQVAEVDFLARDLVADMVRVGVTFLVMEGPHPVGEAEITSVLTPL